MVSPLQSLISTPPPKQGNAAQDISSLMGAINSFRQVGQNNRRLDLQEQQMGAEQQRLAEEKQQAEQMREVRQGGRDAVIARSIALRKDLTPEEADRQQLRFLGVRAEKLDEQGRDSSDTRELMALPFSERQNELLRQGSILLANNPGGDEEMFSRLGLGEDGAARADNLTSSQRDWIEYQRLLEADPEKAQVFGRQAGFVSKEGQKLSSFMEKRLAEANDESVQSSSAARNYEGLASEFENMEAAGGVRGRWSENYKELMGTEDAVSEFRQQYRQIRNSEAVKNLPPGVASDKDIELALSGFPKDTANPEYVARFMRGMAKLAKHRADYAEFKAAYISDKGHERDFNEAWRARAKEEKPQEKGVTDLSDDELLSF